MRPQHKGLEIDIWRKRKKEKHERKNNKRGERKGKEGKREEEKNPKPGTGDNSSLPAPSVTWPGWHCPVGPVSVTELGSGGLRCRSRGTFHRRKSANPSPLE